MEKARMLGMEEAVVGGTEGGRSPTGVPPTTAAPRVLAPGNGKPVPDPAVPEKPVRRRFTAQYKVRILREADRFTSIEHGLGKLATFDQGDKCPKGITDDLLDGFGAGLGCEVAKSEFGMGGNGGQHRGEKQSMPCRGSLATRTGRRGTSSNTNHE
jgi:hypothetical protein